MPRYVALLGVTAAGLLLSGCISAQEMALRHRSACERYGFTPGSEAYSNCLLQLDVGTTAIAIMVSGGPGLYDDHFPLRLARFNTGRLVRADCTVRRLRSLGRLCSKS